MPDQLQLRGGTTTQHATFTGASKEVTVDTTKKTVVVHDGSTVGGSPLMREDASNAALALGSAASPSLKFTGDTNTGLYSPGADQVAISTNGTGRLFVNAGGNVGIGATPISGYPLNIINNGNNFIQFAKTGDALVGSLIGRPSGTADLRLQNSENEPIVFFTNNTERLRISASGAVGLGTSSAQAVFHSKAGATTSAGIFESGSATGSWLSFTDTGTSSYTRVQVGSVGNDLVLRTTDAERVRVTSTGAVGIGNTGPGSYAASFNDLVVGNHTGNHGITIASQSNCTGRILFADGTGGTEVDVGEILYNHTNNSLAISTNRSTAATIDSSGRLLVGTSSSSSATRLVVQGRSDNTTAQGVIHIQRGQTAATSAGNVGDIYFTGSDGGEFALISAAVDGTVGSNDYPGRLVFSTTADGASSPTERMRIHANGFITYGTGSVDSTGLTFGPTRSGAGSAPTLTWNGSFTGTVTACDFLYNGARQGSITTTTSATAYNTSSDYRLKENIEPLTGASSRLSQLQVHRFNFIADPDHTVDGFIAHEAQAVVPECVTGEKNAVDADGNPVYQGIDQSKLVPLLTAALQEAIGRIESLEAEVAQLKGA